MKISSFNPQLPSARKALPAPISAPGTPDPSELKSEPAGYNPTPSGLKKMGQVGGVSALAGFTAVELLLRQAPLSGSLAAGALVGLVGAALTQAAMTDSAEATYKATGQSTDAMTPVFSRSELSFLGWMMAPSQSLFGHARQNPG